MFFSVVWTVTSILLRSCEHAAICAGMTRQQATCVGSLTFRKRGCFSTPSLCVTSCYSLEWLEAPVVQLWQAPCSLAVHMYCASLSPVVQWRCAPCLSAVELGCAPCSPCSSQATRPSTPSDGEESHCIRKQFSQTLVQGRRSQAHCVSLYDFSLVGPWHGKGQDPLLLQ